MLQYLNITNLALLERATIEFDSGFTVVTGETGAGKSVFLGALSLLSGARSDKSLIRSGEDQCELEATLWFENAEPVDAMLSEMGLPVCEEGCLLLKRSIHASKASRIFINGSLATLANLQTLGSFWIDFHGPGEPQRLLKNECQLEMIDLFAHLQDDAERFRTAFRDWKATLSEIDRLAAEKFDAEHTKRKQVNLHQTQDLDVSFVPRQNGSVSHRRVFNGRDLGNSIFGDDKSPGMHPEMAWISTQTLRPKHKLSGQV